MTRSIAGNFILIFLTALPAIFYSCPVSAEPEPDDYKVLKEIIVLEFSKDTPHERGPVVSGVRTRMQTEEKVVALTVDGREDHGDASSNEILNVLAAEKVPVTLFASGNWLDQNAGAAKKLSRDPQFEIANLGLEAKSCFVAGKSTDGNPATGNTEEVFTEIEKNARKIESLTGMLPRFFRAGSAAYDDVAVRIARALGYEVIGSGIMIDKTSGKKPKEITDILLQVSSGSIASISLGISGKDTAEGLRRAIARLRAKGFRFVKLSDYPLE